MVVADINILNNFNGPDAPDVDVIRSCVHCGFCLSSCPTYRITQRERSSPRGRIWLMKQVSTGKLELLDPIFEEEMSLCLNCRACEAVCPSGVHYGEILEASRAQIESHRRGAAQGASDANGRVQPAVRGHATFSCGEQRTQALPTLRNAERGAPIEGTQPRRFGRYGTDDAGAQSSLHGAAWADDPHRG